MTEYRDAILLEVIPLFLLLELIDHDSPINIY